MWFRCPVSGAYGENAAVFNRESDAVMDATWSDAGGWLVGHDARDVVLAALTTRWGPHPSGGRRCLGKEGGQSDLTAEVVQRIKTQLPTVETPDRIHVVQHGNWNEDQTTEAALAYTKEQTRYIRIRDANAYLNVVGGDQAFVQAAIDHPILGAVWQAAFAYYDPDERLDFSDTGELMHILGLGEVGFDEFRARYLESEEGDAIGVSNIDPFATAPTDDNDWVKEGPHLMILVPDQAALEGLSTDLKDPVYVMWKGTPYAHIMVKIAEEQ